MPDHDDFRDTVNHRRKRTVLFASAVPLDISGFRLCPEWREKSDPWTRTPSSLRAKFLFAGRFLTRPARQKYLALANRLRKTFPGIPVLWRLPFGAWWIAETGELDSRLMHGDFEVAELRFAQKLLRPGMTVLDVGAHHGLYSLLAAKCVGRNGQVLAFEASPRECRRLGKHVRINNCSNVRIEPCALGSEHGFADFFVVDGDCDWGNSLRPPIVTESTYKLRVEVRALDDVLAGLGISKVDFIKLDVEGAELSVLQGAKRLLRGSSRPAMLIEVQDLRTQPWGYPAIAIVEFLARFDYRWFSLSGEGALRAIPDELDSYDANLVALPRERLREFRNLIEPVGTDVHPDEVHPSHFRRRGVQLLKSMIRVRQGSQS